MPVLPPVVPAPVRKAPHRSLHVGEAQSKRGPFRRAVTRALISPVVLIFAESNGCNPLEIHLEGLADQRWILAQCHETFVQRALNRIHRSGPRPLRGAQYRRCRLRVHLVACFFSFADLPPFANILCLWEIGVLSSSSESDDVDSSFAAAVGSDDEPARALELDAATATPPAKQKSIASSGRIPR